MQTWNAIQYTTLVTQQNNHATKTVNAYIVYNLDYWPNIPVTSFTLKNCFFGATSLVKKKQ